MKGFILGTKGKISQSFTDEGTRVPITDIVTSPCFIIGFRTAKKDGYDAVIIGAVETKETKKPQANLLKKAGISTPLRFLREVKLDNAQFVEKNGKTGVVIGEAQLFAGDEITPSLFFKKNDQVSVTGTSKGKGFAGVVKRHGFAGGPRTHGQSDRERAPGSIGASATPSRVMRGKRMAGRMGGERVTVKGITVVEAT
ncbi:MAG: 50S ribosomal protein L3, partial [Candidatus Paceibacterota bacterium]